MTDFCSFPQPVPSPERSLSFIGLALDNSIEGAVCSNCDVSDGGSLGAHELENKAAEINASHIIHLYFMIDADLLEFA